MKKGPTPVRTVPIEAFSTFLMKATVHGRIITSTKAGGGMTLCQS